MIKRILYNDISNGPGFRTTIFLSGCPGVIWNSKLKRYTHCDGCFNFEAWDFNKGNILDGYLMNEILKSLSYEYINGVSILGGEPLCKQNQQEVAKIIESVKGCYNNKTIWLWTGYIYTKNIFNRNRIPHTKWTNYILKNINVLVDGPFQKDKFDINLKYRGSSNQRIIYLNGGEKDGR